MRSKRYRDDLPGHRTITTRDGYYAYLKSAEWQAVKERYLRSKLATCCYGCGIPWNSTFHFHHKTYKNLGCERLIDIVPVCPWCHRRIHRLHAKLGGSLWTAPRKASSIRRRRERAQ